ncbi:MAG: esterase-like activity of phytase family protein [Proteobacteria bacterium]|nr:esterase-like activity of phytase family protein [Pseudomonadota bacterium]
MKGKPLDKKRDLDAESIKALDGNLTKGNVLVAFERRHRIGVFPIRNGELQAPVRYLKLPPEALKMKANSGFESVEVLKGGPYQGSIIAFSERFPGPTADHVGWMWVKGEPQRITMVDHHGFEITDAASLPDGTLLVLERRFRWTEGVKMQLRRIPVADIKPGARLDGEMLLEADMGYQIDNMEGLSVHKGPSGETVLTLISDDNFNHLLQRTLLLQFTLTDVR